MEVMYQRIYQSKRTLERRVEVGRDAICNSLAILSDDTPANEPVLERQAAMFLRSCTRHSRSQPAPASDFIGE